MPQELLCVVVCYCLSRQSRFEGIVRDQRRCDCGVFVVVAGTGEAVSFAPEKDVSDRQQWQAKNKKERMTLVGAVSLSPACQVIGKP